MAPGSSTATGNYILHFLAYFGLAGALLLYYHDTTVGHLEAVATAAGFGIGVELIQLQMPYRAFSTVDILLNTAGASVVLLDHQIDVVSRLIEFEENVIEAATDF